MSDWKVTFHGNFWGHPEGHAPEGELAVNRTVPLGDRNIFIPALYTFPEGLVLDLCASAEPEAIRSFVKNWGLEAGEPDAFTEEERQQMEAEHPLSFPFEASIDKNGTTLLQKHGCSVCWIPKGCLPKGAENDPEVERILRRYHLNPRFGWSLHRIAFPWAKDGRRTESAQPTPTGAPSLKGLTLTLTEQPAWIPGSSFAASKVGQTFSFLHPITKKEHTLTVLSLEHEQLDPVDAQPPAPTLIYGILRYTLSPDLPDSEFAIVQRQKCCPLNTNASGAASIGIIGGADGPTAIYVSSEGEKQNVHTALSFPAVPLENEARWRMKFLKPKRPSLTVALLS